MKEKFDWLREQLRRLLSQPEIADDGRPRNAVAYVRSAVESAEAMALQREALQTWADGAGCHIVRWYGEGGKAAGKDPELDKLLMDAASDGRGFDAVLVWDYARVSRSPRVCWR